MTTTQPLPSVPLLTFDIYGTLIDWETGLLTALTPLSSRLDASHPLSSPSALGTAFNAHERRVQSLDPTLLYAQVLKQAYISLAKECGALPPSTEGKSADELLDAEATAVGASIGTWPAFPDTVSAMRRLKGMGYKLVPLSNVDRVSFGKTLSGPLAGLSEDGKPFFDAVYTAQDIGSYKPDLRNFEYMLENVRREFGVEKGDVLHVAQSLFHDHEPAKRIGLKSVWIERGEGGRSKMGGDVDEYLGGEEPRVAFGWRFKDLAEFADAVEKEKAAV